MSDSLQVERATERAPEGFLAVDADGVVTRIDATAAQLLGVDREAVTGDPVGTLDPDLPLAERCREALTDGRAVAFDSRDERGRVLSGTAHPVAGAVSVVLRDLTDRRHTAQTLESNTQGLERLHDIATDSTLGFETKVERMLAVGTEQLGTAHGLLVNIEGDTHEVVSAVGPEHGDWESELTPGTETPLSETYCRHTLDSEGTVAIGAAGTERPDDPGYDRTGLECYLGASVTVDGEQYGTVCFVDPDPRQRAFTERERTFAELLTSWVHYLLEQRAHERELKQQQAFTESLIDSLPDPLYAFDNDGTLVRWNDRLEAVTGRDETALESMRPGEFVADEDSERLAAATRRIRNGEEEFVSVEASLETAGGEQIPYEFSGAPLRDGRGDVVGVVGVGRDISEQQEHRRRLSGLLNVTQQFMQAEDPEEVAELVVNAARDLLGFETSVFRLYDRETKTLEPVAVTDRTEALLGSRPVYELGEGHPGEVFATGEPRVFDDLQAADRAVGPLRSAMYYPAGVRGTLSIGSTEPDAFDATDERLLGLLSTSAAAACTRAKRERDVREARAHTERVLERINGMLSKTTEVLVEATTRAEIEEGVTRELAAAEPYTFAWLGRPDLASEQLEPTAWAGDVDLPAGGWSFALDADDPIGRTYREGVSRQLDCGSGTPDCTPWSGLATEVESLIAVPLAYKDTTYGVLVVCAEDTGALDERERAVLEALGGATANAINAVERGRILDATETIELEFAVSDDDLLFSRLSGGSECHVESAGSEFRADGGVQLYLAATGVEAGSFVERVREDPEVETATCIVAREDECLLELEVAESLLTTLTEHGAALDSVVAEGGTTRITVDLPYEAEARELFGLVEEQYPGTELLGYHERERPVETRQDFTAEISDRLTGRQETALRTAYLGGFFEWPRGIDGNELAEAMDITRPTYHQHLRAAQAKVFEELFE